MVQKSYESHPEAPQSFGFGLFALLTSFPGGTTTPLGGVKVSGTHLDGNSGLYSFPISICFYSGLKNGHKMMVWDLNHSLGRVESSDLVQNGLNYSPDVVVGLYWTKER